MNEAAGPSPVDHDLDLDIPTATLLAWNTLLLENREPLVHLP